MRLLLVHGSFTTEGREGWPLAVAGYLAPKYGYAPERAAQARQPAIGVLGLLGGALTHSHARGHEYFLGDAPTALDVYAAVGLAPIAPLAHDVCPMLASVRHARETLESPALLAHRHMLFQRHLALPVCF